MTPQPRFLFVHSHYPAFLESLYAHDPSLKSLDFERQRRSVFDTFFGVSDAYSHGLGLLGVEAEEVIADADVLQAQWAREHGLALSGNIHDRRRAIVAAQIDHCRPDVLYVFEWNPLGDRFVEQMKSRVRLAVGQIASPLPANRTFRGYDLMVSSYPPIVDHVRGAGGDAALLRLAFDDRILDRLPQTAPSLDISFVGGFAPSHPDRIAWLEALSSEVALDVYGYGAERIPPDSPLRARHRGEAWGLRMYEVLARSRLTLNRHAYIDVRGVIRHDCANNMRLYEATGVGTCLVTEDRANLASMFDPERDVVAYTSDADCIEKLRYYAQHTEARAAIAAAGRRRTLAEHTYPHRMAELLAIINDRLRRPAPARTEVTF